MKTAIFYRISSLTLLMLLMALGFAWAQQPALQYFRPYDQRGINVFETSKEDTVEFDGLKVRFGANFTQQFQNLRHENRATPNEVNGVDLNKPIEIGSGFNLAMANLNIDVQLADGIRVSLVSYMSSRHHPEFWVKGGYFQIDKLTVLNNEFLNKLWKNLTLKIGHMEINYGDAHFRRSDGGNAFFNPFVENNLMDAFTTEIGAELYWQKNGILAMVGMTDGEIQGNVTRPDDREPSIYGKLGYDKSINENTRVRLTGSIYTTKSSIRNTLYAGDRTGSHYYMVLENANATTAAQFSSGRINPGFTDNIQAIMINPFVKVSGLEFFGTYEIAKGRSAAETDDREFNQIAADVLYRFANDKFYVGARYNNATGDLAGIPNEVSIDRTAFAAGWFITKNILFKAEYVTQKYNDYPDAHIFHQGKFNGWLVEGIIAF